MAEPKPIVRDEMMDLSSHGRKGNSPGPRELAAMFEAEIQRHETNAFQHLDKFKMFQDLYRSEPTAIEGVPDDAVFAKTSIMEAFRDVETVYANMVASIFTARPWFQVSGEEGDEEQAAEEAGDWQDIIEHQLRKMKFMSKKDLPVRGIVLNGTGVVETPWRFGVRWNDKGNEYVREIVDDEPDFVHVPILGFHFDDPAMDIEDAPWISSESDPSANQVRKMLASIKGIQGAIVDEAAFEDAVKDEKGSNERNRRIREVRQKQGFNENQAPNRVHVDNRWGFHPGNMKSPITWRFITINRSRTVAQIPNPFTKGFKPYLKATFIPVENSFYGMGLGHLLHRPQIEINHNRALMRNKFLLWVYGMFMRRGGSADRNLTIFPAPGKTLLESYYGQLTPVDIDLTGMSTGIQLEALTKEDMRLSSNASLQSQTQVTGATAREVGQVSTEVMKRNLPSAGSMVENMFRPWLQRVIDLDDQFLPDEVVVAVLGTDGRWRRRKILKASLPVAPEPFVKVATDMDFSIAEQRRLTSLLDTLANVADRFGESLKLSGFSVMVFLKQIAVAFGANPNEVFSKKRAKLAQEQAAAQQQREQALQDEARIREIMDARKKQALFVAQMQSQVAAGKPPLPPPKLPQVVDVG